MGTVPRVCIGKCEYCTPGMVMNMYRQVWVLYPGYGHEYVQVSVGTVPLVWL